MKIYSILFERLFAFFHKGASTNPSHEKFDGAVLTSIIISIPVFLNILSILLIISVLFKIDLYLSTLYGAIGMIILIGFNMLYFLRKDKYLIIRSQTSELSKKKRIMYTFFSCAYFLGSFILFFFLLKIRV
jgi:hypothetical protein